MLAAGDVENILLATSVDIGSAGGDLYYGAARINASAAVSAAVSSVARDSSAPTVSLTSPYSGTTVKGLVAVNVSAIDNVGVSRVDLIVNGIKRGSDSV